MNKFFKSLMFLAPDDGGASGGASGSGNEGSNESEQNTDNEAKFTQADLTRIAAREKKQGAASAYKELGFESEEDAKKAVAAWKKAEDDKKDELTKAQEAKATAERERNEAQAKADILDKKFKVMETGVTGKNIEAVLLLANSRMTDGVSFEDALQEVKKDFPAMFEEEKPKSSGTGHSTNNPRKSQKDNKGESIGKRLAEQKTSQSQNKKSPYFTR